LLCGSYVCGTYTGGVPDAVVARRITRPKAVDASVIRRRACARTVVASFVRTLRGRRAGVGPGRAHLRCQDEGAQEPAREGHRCRGALRASLVRLFRFTECGRSRRQVPRLHLALRRSKRPAMRVLRAERPGNTHGAYSEHSVEDEEDGGRDGVDDDVDGGFNIHGGVDGTCPCRSDQDERSQVAAHLHVVIAVIVIM